MAANPRSRASDWVIMPRNSERKIRDCCAKVVALEDDSPEFAPTLEELRAAIRSHLHGLRDQVAQLAFVLAAENESIHVI